ncbi:MAG: YrvL family regulatory protein [Romboutsia sp.]|uniref:YrvL family regulatory protein n=1 Tax=Romboutsia sp. TaxID=1965302 RepID=UPI003F344E28
MINKEKINDIIGITLVGSIFFLIVFCVLFFFVSTLLYILGFEYDSFSSLLKFCMLYFIISTPIDFIIQGFFKVLYELIDITKPQCDLLYIFVDICFNTTLLGFLDFIVIDVNCSIITALLFSIVSSIAGYIIENKLDDKNLSSSK